MKRRSGEGSRTAASVSRAVDASEKAAIDRPSRPRPRSSSTLAPDRPGRAGSWRRSTTGPCRLVVVPCAITAEPGADADCASGLPEARRDEVDRQAGSRPSVDQRCRYGGEPRRRIHDRSVRPGGRRRRSGSRRRPALVQFDDGAAAGCRSGWPRVSPVTSEPVVRKLAPLTPCAEVATAGREERLEPSPGGGVRRSDGYAPALKITSYSPKRVRGRGVEGAGRDRSRSRKASSRSDQTSWFTAPVSTGMRGTPVNRLAESAAPIGVGRCEPDVVVAPDRGEPHLGRRVGRRRRADRPAASRRSALSKGDVASCGRRPASQQLVQGPDRGRGVDAERIGVGGAGFHATAEVAGLGHAGW